MVKTSRDSFLKVKEVQDDLDAISLLGETGLSASEVASAIQSIASGDIVGSSLTTEQTAALGKAEVLVQTGLTDAELLASQLKAHELVGLEASASEINGVVTNFEEYISSINNIIIDTMYYTKNFRTANTVAKVLATKTGDKEITVTTLSDVSDYSTVYNYSIVIKYTNGIYKSYIIDSTNTATGVIILDSLLENYTVDSFMMMHDSNGGQHLSEYGYAGLAQYVFNELQNEKKNK